MAVRRHEDATSPPPRQDWFPRRVEGGSYSGGMTRRFSPRRTARRAAAVTLAAQAATVAGLLVFDSRRKRDKPDVRLPRVESHDLAVQGGDLRIYTTGEPLFEDMLADIEAAQTRIFFESYIWKGDDTGVAFRDALVRAHERGVEVFVAFDEFANLVVPRAFFRSLPDGIHVKRHPLIGRFPWLTPRQVGRNHRKLLIVDEGAPTAAAYLGGYNIGSLYADRWRDTHARVSGEMVVELANAFVDYWNNAPGATTPHLHQPAARTWSTTMRVHRNSPVDSVYPIRNMYLEAIDRSEHHVYLTAAYFIPDGVLTRALVEAVHRGVDVQIIVPHFSNHIVADWLSRASYAELLKGGVRILRYENAMVHAKTATIDGRWTTLGTANLDRLSLAGNYEINLEILDKDVARQMEEVFQADAENCNELTLEEWTGRPMIARVTEGLLAPYRPLL